MALNSLICADVPLRNCSLTHVILFLLYIIISGTYILDGLNAQTTATLFAANLSCSSPSELSDGGEISTQEEADLDTGTAAGASDSDDSVSAEGAKTEDDAADGFGSLQDSETAATDALLPSSSSILSKYGQSLPLPPRPVFPNLSRFSL